MKIDLTIEQVNALVHVMQLALEDQECYADDGDFGSDLIPSDRIARIAALRECAGVAMILTLHQTARRFENLAEEFRDQHEIALTLEGANHA